MKQFRCEGNGFNFHEGSDFTGFTLAELFLWMGVELPAKGSVTHHFCDGERQRRYGLPDFAEEPLDGGVEHGDWFTVEVTRS